MKYFAILCLLVSVAAHAEVMNMALSPVVTCKSKSYWFTLLPDLEDVKEDDVISEEQLSKLGFVSHIYHKKNLVAVSYESNSRPLINADGSRYWNVASAVEIKISKDELKNEVKKAVFRGTDNGGLPTESGYCIGEIK